MADRPLGRDTKATQLAWGRVAQAIPPAPTLFRGPVPSKSPAIWRFRNPRYRNQVTGTCVGQSGAAMAETSIRTPVQFTDASEPNPPIDLSPIWVYVQSRLRCEKEGIRIFGGEGSIVSYALLAMKDEGFIAWEDWPGTPENERKAQGRTVPKNAMEAKRYRPIDQNDGVRRLTSPEHCLEAMAGGWSEWIGIPWPNGAMNTNSEGYFPLKGRSVGGHAVELLGYDLDADRVWVGNSWAGWGDAASIGWTQWSSMARLLSESNLADGTSEACVISEVDGWKQKAKRKRARDVL